MTANGPWMLRPLRHDDLPLYRPLRLEALRNHPEAFGSSFEEEQGSDLSHMIGSPPNVTFGGFVDGALVGIIGLIVSQKFKQRHKGQIVGAYVAPPWRRTGLAQVLLGQLIADARTSGLLLLTLSVTVGNESARRLYLNAGFGAYGIEPGAIMLGRRLFDAELMVLRLSQI